MARQEQNEGFRVLDDFVCEAISPPSVPKADPGKQGQNEGVGVLPELVVEVSRTDPEQENENTDDARSPQR